MNKEHSPYATVAALLATARLCWPMNILLAAVTFWQAQDMWQAAVDAVLLLVLLWLHIRVDFDRRIFTAWQQGVGYEAAFDADLAALGLGHARVAGAVERCRGALCWWKRMLWITLAQAVWTVWVCGQTHF